MEEGQGRYQTTASDFGARLAPEVTGRRVEESLPASAECQSLRIDVSTLGRPPFCCRPRLPTSRSAVQPERALAPRGRGAPRRNAGGRGTARGRREEGERRHEVRGFVVVVIERKDVNDWLKWSLKRMCGRQERCYEEGGMTLLSGRGG
jgi:hypothetical protein